MIRQTLLSTAMHDEDEVREPPSGMLKVTVVADIALLAWTPTDHTAEWVDPPACSFQVFARSLPLALRPAWDDNHPGVATIDLAAPLPTRERGPRAPNSHQPWTAELDAQLRNTWLAAATSSPAPAMIAEIADIMAAAATASVHDSPGWAAIMTSPDEPRPDNPAAPITDAVSDLDP